MDANMDPEAEINRTPFCKSILSEWCSQNADVGSSQVYILSS